MKVMQDSKGDKNAVVNFGKSVQCTDEFLQVWESLSSQRQRIIGKKVRLLIANPSHPSLKVHRLKRADGDVWECYLIRRFPHRLLFQRVDDKILLVQMGGHRLVDRCHETRF